MITCHNIKQLEMESHMGLYLDQFFNVSSLPHGNIIRQHNINFHLQTLLCQICQLNPRPALITSKNSGRLKIFKILLKFRFLWVQFSKPFVLFFFWADTILFSCYWTQFSRKSFFKVVSVKNCCPMLKMLYNYLSLILIHH